MDQPEQTVEQREAAVAVRERLVRARELALAGRENAVAGMESAATTREVRDHRAVVRDEASDHRDAQASGRDAASDVPSAGATPDTLSQARRLLTSERATAVADRSHAASDRRHAASDRAAARADRQVADADSRLVSEEHDRDTFDELTGVLRRGPGFRIMEAALSASCTRDEDVVLGFVDVVGLKVVNDSSGHAAGDLLLADVAGALRSGVGSRGVVTRLGGDEFVVLLVDVSMAHAGRLMAQIHESLARRVPPGAVTVGLAALEPEDNLDVLIARADADLYRQRGSGTTDR